MGTIIFNGLIKLIEGWFKVRSSKQDAEASYNQSLLKGEQDWDIEAMKASRYSWKDEFIAIIWYSPLYLGWISEEEGEHIVPASEWVSFVNSLPAWWWVGAFGIMAASFGLRWYFKDKNIPKP